MGDDIGLGSVTGCRLWSLGDHRQHTEMRENQNQEAANTSAFATFDAQFLKALLETDQLKDPEHGVRYFKDTRRPHRFQAVAYSDHYNYHQLRESYRIQAPSDSQLLEDRFPCDKRDD